ncbi:hypothetical protein M8C21_012234, partial [Ambrosia artemisiifolia]
FKRNRGNLGFNWVIAINSKQSIQTIDLFPQAVAAKDYTVDMATATKDYTVDMAVARRTTRSRRPNKPRTTPILWWRSKLKSLVHFSLNMAINGLKRFVVHVKGIPIGHFCHGPSSPKNEDDILREQIHWVYENCGSVPFSSLEHPKFNAILNKLRLPSVGRMDLAGERLDSGYKQARIRDAMFFQIASDGWKSNRGFESFDSFDSLVNLLVNLPNGTGLIDGRCLQTGNVSELFKVANFINNKSHVKKSLVKYHLQEYGRVGLLRVPINGGNIFVFAFETVFDFVEDVLSSARALQLVVLDEGYKFRRRIKLRGRLKK